MGKFSTQRVRMADRQISVIEVFVPNIELVADVDGG